MAQSRILFCIAIGLGLIPAVSAGAWTLHSDLVQINVEVNAGDAPVVSAEINGRPVRLAIAPDGPRVVLLNPDAAERLGLRANPLLSMGVRLDILGAVSRGRTGRARLSVEGLSPFRQRIVWFEDRDVTDVADGVIGTPGLQNIDRLVFTVDAPDRDPAAVMNVARFAGDRGFEWTFRAPGNGREFDVSLSFIERSNLDSVSQTALQNRGMIAEAAPDLVFESFWFFDRALAFEHPNRSIRFDGVGPDSFIRFARAEEVETHDARQEYVRQHGPIERITVLGSTDAELDDYKVTLGNDVLGNCWRIEFDYRTDAVTLRCPERASASED